ncbi:DsbA family protein [Carboxylicivirga taeanensis]|uniref:DsbA family protein n=1 Tax=Carboxylicivirga taeanensis TaxID=1416875 RepID=UPI003F6E30C5
MSRYRKINGWLYLFLLGALSALVWAYFEFSSDEQLEEIKQVRVSDIVFGQESAEQSIILYYDYNCSYCKKFFDEVYPSLHDDFIRTGKIKLVLRLICRGNDAMALRAYQTAICINKFGSYEKLHALLLHNSQIMYTEHFNQLIDDYVVENEFLGECILDSDGSDIIRNIYEFQVLKTKGTPTFVLGSDVISGFKDYNYLKKKINKL